MPNDEYRLPREELEWTRMGDIITDAFGLTQEMSTQLFANAGPSDRRVYLREGQVVGGLVQVPMGQFWGGQSVRLGGIAAVAIAPEARGTGAASSMMGAALRDLHGQGFLLSALYPSNQPLYRRAGFEQAGTHLRHTVRVKEVPRVERELPVRAMKPEDFPLLQALYTEVARQRPGYLDRGPYVWNRVRNFRGMVTQGFWVGASRPEGYVFLGKQRRPDSFSDLQLTDLVAATPRAARRLWSLLADHGTITKELSWHGPLDDGLLHLFPEQVVLSSSEPAYTWMLRVVNLPGALERRGYGSLLRGRLELEVEDEWLEENAGRWVLEVSDGVGRVTRGGTGTLRCHVRALACLYSGFRNATELALAGQVEGSEAALEQANQLFGGRMPSMPDMF